MYAYPDLEGPRGIGVGSGLVYWTNGDASPPSVGRAGVDGTPAPVKNFVLLSDSLKPIAWPTVGGGRLYFATIFGLFSTDLNGTLPGGLVGSHAFGGITTFGSRLYWANYTEGTVGRANLDFSSPDFAFMRGLGNPTGIAVDGGATPAPSSPVAPAVAPKVAPKKCKKHKKKHRSASAAKKHKKKCKKKRRK